jgi:hypothetical protein
MINKELNRKLTTTILKSSKKYHSSLIIMTQIRIYLLDKEINSLQAQKIQLKVHFLSYSLSFLSHINIQLAT